MKRFIAFIGFIAFTTFGIYAQDVSSQELINKAWGAHGKNDIEATFTYTQQLINLYQAQADREQAALTALPENKSEIQAVATLNNVATAYFIQAESYIRQGKISEAEKALQSIIDKYPYAQAWDARGWFWSIKEKAEITLKKLHEGGIAEEEELKGVVSKVILHDEGTEFPVDYDKYGHFSRLGTSEYRYTIIDPTGLSKATGEGIYPNTSSVRFDPRFVEIKRQLYKIDQWKILNSRDLSTAFYKWNMCPEAQGLRQFYIGDILERSGLIKSAVKAYYAVLVHFPRTIARTYWNTPWYPGKAALFRIKYLLRTHPELDLKLEEAHIEVANGTDNEIRNDVFSVNPGRLVRRSLMERLCFAKEKRRKLGKAIEARGGKKARLVKYASGDWQFLVDDKPFIIKAITYLPTRVGESPDDGTLENWTTQDLNRNGLIDGPYDAWVDENRNNVQDKNEKTVGDFELMHQMGVNAIRVYHQPHPLNKKLFRQMYEKYGIYILLGDFLGKYAIGSGASWEQGTDYDNPTHKKNMLESVRGMVEEFKDEPYVIVWLLGNENVYGLGCNADKKPESFFAFANEAARLIKSIDPLQRPVAIVSGDSLYLEAFAKYAPDIDIFGTNAYRGKYGFLDLWEEIKRVADRAAMITEYGASCYAKGYSLDDAEEYQANYHKGNWFDILYNSYGYGSGNAVGGIIFEWLDEWWKAYEPTHHDKGGLFAGPFLDGYMREEWLGLCGQGKGTNSPYLRVLRKSYFVYKDLWKGN